MHIKRVRIENIRGFGGGKRAVDIDFTRPDGTLYGWTVIAGRNGAGKTTFVRALALAVAGPRIGRSLVESFSGWIHGKERTGSIEIHYEHHRNDQFFGGKRNRPAGSVLAGIGLERFRRGAEPEVHEIPAQTKKLERTWRGPWSENPGGWFVAGYGPFRRLSGHAVDAQRLMSASGHLARLVSLFREDASLVECIEWLRSVYLRMLEGHADATRLLVSVLRLLGDGLLPDGMVVDRVDSDALWVKQGNAILPLRQLSDGYRITAALVLDIARQLADCYGELDVRSADGPVVVMNPGTIIIDEMDVHLHVSWQQRIGFWLKDHFPNIQFIVTTHSPFICQAADPNGLIRLPPPGSKETARHITGDDFARIVYGSADDAVMTDLFGLDSTYSPPSLLKRQELARLRGKQFKGKVTAAEKKQIDVLQHELPLGPRDDVLTALRGLRTAEK